MAVVILGGLLFGFGLTVPIEHEKEDGISGWPFTMFYLFACIAAGLIYYLCPGLRINAWLYALINLVAAVVASLIGSLFCILLQIPCDSKLVKILTVLLSIAAGISAEYLGWPILQSTSLPVLALLLPGIVLVEAVVSGLFVFFLFFWLSQIYHLLANGFAILLAVAAAAGTIYWGWACLQNNSSPVLAILLPGIVLCGSSLVGLIGHLIFLPPKIRKGCFDGLKEGFKKH